MRRLVLAAEASAAGRGMARQRLQGPPCSRDDCRGIRELGQPAVSKGRIRHPGGGRKRTVEHDPSLREDLDRLVEPTSRGDPESPLRWTSRACVAAALKRQGHQVSHRMVAEPLHDMGYSLQANWRGRNTRTATPSTWTGRCNCNSPWESRDLSGESRTVGGSCVPKRRSKAA